MNGFGFDTKIVEHLIDSGAHWAGPTHIIFDVLGVGVVFEIGVENNLVDETGSVFDVCGIGGGVGAVEREMEFEVGEIFFQLEEIVEVEHFVEGASAVEVVHYAVIGVKRPC